MMKDIFRITRVEEPKVQGGRTNTPPSFKLKPVIVIKPKTTTSKK